MEIVSESSGWVQILAGSKWIVKLDSVDRLALEYFGEFARVNFPLLHMGSAQA